MCRTVTNRPRCIDIHTHLTGGAVMSLPMILGAIALYLFVSRCAIGFFYAASKGVDITNSKDRAALLVPPFGEFLLIWGLIQFFIFVPVSKLSGAGVGIYKWREDKAVRKVALESQRTAYEMKLAAVGLTPDDIPGYVDAGDLEAYVQAQRESGLIAEPVDLTEIRKKVRAEYKKAHKM
jgi:hypothetical protein